jgi:DNA-binding response OmpR family regulator
VTKPFSPKEVMARVNAILKRTQPEKNATIVSDGLEIDIAGRNVYVDGEKINMTPKEYELLFYLAQNKGIAISRDKLLSNVWGYDFYGDDRTVDTHVKMLRSSLGKYRDKIVTLRGLGYKIEL